MDMNEQQTLAEKLKKPGTQVKACFLDENNRKQLRAMIWEDTGSLVVIPRPGLLVLDADNEEECKLLEKIYKEMVNAALHPLVVQSGRGQHLWCNVQTGEDDVQSIKYWRSLIAKKKMDRSSSYIRIPLTPHPGGLPVFIKEGSIEDLFKFAEPSDAPKLAYSDNTSESSIADITAETNVCQSIVTTGTNSRAWKSEFQQLRWLSPAFQESTQTLLDFKQDEIGGDNTRSGVLFKLATAYVRSNKTFEEYIKDVMNSKIGEVLDGEKKDPEWIHKFIWDKVPIFTGQARFVPVNKYECKLNPDEIIFKIGSDRKILGALIKECNIRGSAEIKISIALLSGYAGVSGVTGYAAIKRLVSVGLVVYTHGTGFLESPTLKIVDEEGTTDSVKKAKSLILTPQEQAVYDAHISSDLSRILGKGLFVVAKLSQKSYTAKELTASLPGAISVPTIYKTLKLLKELELVRVYEGKTGAKYKLLNFTEERLKIVKSKSGLEVSKEEKALKEVQAKSRKKKLHYFEWKESLRQLTL